MNFYFRLTLAKNACMKNHIYEAKIPDQHGLVSYTPEENAVWKALYERQIKLIEGRACEEFILGVKRLGLTKDRIPQIPEVSQKLYEATGWAVYPVKALISFKEFFQLLAERKFPVATFIRLPEELDYLKEPDIFHEIFGHCPLLTHQAFADFTQKVGELGLSMNQEERVLLARLYWFTVEFGLIKTGQGVRIYGGGILSSKGETVYALDSEIPKRHNFDLITVLRTTYRYDEMQKNYFIIDSFDFLFDLIMKDLRIVFKEAKNGGIEAPEDMDVRSC
jgi:phenylalanine-4-hydroxylase